MGRRWAKKSYFCRVINDKKLEKHNDERVLEQAGVRLTAVRLLVWRTLRAQLHDAFSLADVEALLPTVDRSTLFRTLVSLTDAHLLHEIDDGSGAQKYCVCHHDDTRLCLGHVHLTCTRCHRTFCLPNVAIPSVPLPEGFEAHETEYVVKGTCSRCAAAATSDSRRSSV